jgi:hypothetical protein
MFILDRMRFPTVPRFSQVRARTWARLDAARATSRHWSNPVITALLKRMIQRVAPALLVAFQRPSSATHGPIHRDVKVCLDILDDDVGQSIQPKLQQATLVRATPGAIHVRQAHGDAAHAVSIPGQGEAQPPFHMCTQALSQREIARLNIDLHVSSSGAAISTQVDFRLANSPIKFEYFLPFIR